MQSPYRPLTHPITIFLLLRIFLIFFAFYFVPERRRHPRPEQAAATRHSGEQFLRLGSFHAMAVITHDFLTSRRTLRYLAHLPTPHGLYSGETVAAVRPLSGELKNVHFVLNKTHAVIYHQLRAGLMASRDFCGQLDLSSNPMLACKRASFFFYFQPLTA